MCRKPSSAARITSSAKPNLNPGLHGRDMRKVFDTPDYRVMIVANKFQTGFDQPKLVAMYLDKKISGVEAVQTLSRLNRTFPGKDKTFVIDFANKAEEILASFKTFYRDAQVADIQDPNIVYDIKQRLDGMLHLRAGRGGGLRRRHRRSEVTHQKLYSLTQAPTDRFNGKLKTLNDAIDQWEKAWEKAHDEGDDKDMEQADVQRSEYSKARDELMIFSESLTKFVRSYEYVAQLVDFGDPSLEAFASYARLLRKRLKGIAAEQVDLGDLKLTHYKIKKGGDLTGRPVQAETPELARHDRQRLARRPRPREEVPHRTDREAQQRLRQGHHRHRSGGLGRACVRDAARRQRGDGPGAEQHHGPSHEGGSAHESHLRHRCRHEQPHQHGDQAAQRRVDARCVPDGGV